MLEDWAIGCPTNWQEVIKNEKGNSPRKLPFGCFQRHVERQSLHYEVDRKYTRDIEIDGVVYPLFKMEISSASHPFYTGKMKLVDTAGRVDKFMSRYGNRNAQKK